MQVAILLGRGIEGCGVTKYTIELSKYFKKNSIKYKIFCSDDKKYTRKDSHNSNEFELFKLKSDIDHIYEKINKFDFVIINSLPPKNFNDKQLKNWIKILKNIKIKKILIQHDHAIQSIKRNGALDQSILLSDKIFVHSKHNPFSNYVRNISSISIEEFMPGLYFDEVKKKYWKSINEQDHFHCKWIGRTTSWKGYDLILPFYKNYLNNSFKTSLEGLEKSPAFISIKKDFIEKYPDFFVINDINNIEDNRCNICGPYIQNELLDRLSRCAFGYQLSILKPSFISKSIEYTHSEVVCSGAIPIFRSEYGERCIHRYYDKPLIECADSGTIWMNENNFQKTYNKMKYLAENPEERDELRKKAYNFYKLHINADDVFDDLIEKIKTDTENKSSVNIFF